MKKALFIIFIGFTLLGFFTLLGVYLWIDHDVKENVQIAEEKYYEHGEDALIIFLQDENNSPYDRTHVAIWSLGHIQSEKALPILYKYYHNDPEGKTCYGKHDAELCQYEIHKAIVAIEKGRLLSHARLKWIS